MNHQRVMTQLHPRTVTDLSYFVSFLLSATPRLQLSSGGMELKVGRIMVRPTGIEPVLRVPETLVISFSLRARGKVFLSSGR